MTGLRGSVAPLADAYDAALLDLDGVVYLGAEPVARAAETIAASTRRGMRAVFVTNNASRSPAAIADQLLGMAIPAEPEQVVTSAQAAARVLAGGLAPGAAVLVVGTPALADEIRAVGLRPVGAAADAPQAVVSGYSPTLCYPELAEAALAIRAGAKWVATNLDATIPTPRGLLPGNGAVAALLETATGVAPVAAGKPAAPLHEEAARRALARRPLVVGDRIDTDIAGATAAGLDSLLVLTGVASAADLVLAPPGARPTYVTADLRGLLEPHPDVDRVGPTFTCRGARAEVRGRVVYVTEAADPYDALRAAAVAAWTVFDRSGAPPEDVVGLGLAPPDVAAASARAEAGTRVRGRR